MKVVLHGFIGEFDGDSETWKSYTERLTQYFIANNVKSADKQCAIFLSVCGPTTYQLIRNIAAPVKPTEHLFHWLVELVEKHWNPKLSVIVSRYNFNTIMKQPGESIADYAAELHKIGEHQDTRSCVSSQDSHVALKGVIYKNR